VSVGGILRGALRVVGGLVPSALAGGFALSTLAAVSEPPVALVHSLLLGGLYGVFVVLLIRLFRVAPWGYPVAGIVCGPVPAVLLTAGNAELASNSSAGDRGGMWFVLLLFGLVLGLLEWARASRRARASSGA